MGGGVGMAAASARWLLPVVTKGIITEVITGWAQLSHVQAQRWSLEGQGELAGSLLGHQSHEISKACTETPSANSRCQEQEQNSWPGTEQGAAGGRSFPASHPQLRARAAAVPRGSPESFYRAGTSPPHLHPGDRPTPSLRP